MGTKSSIFTTRVKIPLLVFMSEIKRSHTEKVKISISFVLQNCNNSVYSNMRQPSRQRHNFFRSRFASNLMVFTVNDIGCKRCLQLKNISILRLNKRTSRNLPRKNAYRKLRLPDIACFHYVKLLVTSLTS